MASKNLKEFFKKLDFFGWPVVVSLEIYTLLFVIGFLLYKLLFKYASFSDWGLAAWIIWSLAFVLLALNFVVIDKLYLGFIWNKDVLAVKEFDKMEEELNAYAKRGKQLTPENYYKGLQIFSGFFEFTLFALYLALDLSRFLWFFETLKYARKEFFVLKRYGKKRSEIVYGFRSLFDETKGDYFYQPFVIPIIKKLRK